MEVGSFSRVGETEGKACLYWGFDIVETKTSAGRRGGGFDPRKNYRPRFYVLFLSLKQKQKGLLRRQKS